MTSANSRLDESSHGPSSGSTTLHGRIEAIGIHDLLRVSTSKGSTGRLLVFNDDEDAEIYYEQGRLVAVVAGTSFGRESLDQVLRMQHGEFEFAVGLRTSADRQTANLHEAMLASVREYYERQVRARQSASGAGEEARSSGVHKIDGQEKPAPSAGPATTINPSAPRASEPSQGGARPALTNAVATSAAPSANAVPRVGAPATAQSAAVTRPSPANPSPTLSTKPATPPPPQPAAQAQLSPGELGSATIDASGRVLRRLGAVTQHDAALAALALKLAARLGPSLGAREAQGVELHAPGDKSLICAVVADGIRISKISTEADVESIWKQLKS